MPLQAICQKCKFVLYDGKDLKPPYEIIQGHDGRCPNCGRKLSQMPMDFEIQHEETTIGLHLKKFLKR